MILSLQDWLVFLKTTDGLIALPMLLGGAVLMFFGWRLWKVCVVLSFGLIGVGVTAMLTDAADGQWVLPVLGGITLGVLSYFPAHYSVAFLGGLLGASGVLHFLGGFGFGGTIYWIGGLVGLIGATAYAFINRRMVVILVTAFLGAVMLLSGLMVFVMLSPPLYGTFVSMASGSLFVVPFLLIVPTVMSCFYQIAEVNRLQAEL